MNADAWEFTAEGGKHAVFAYNGEDSLYRRRVLRMRKSDISTAAAVVQEKQFERHAPRITAIEEEKVFCKNNIAQIQMEKILRPTLGPQYLDAPVSVKISGSFAATLWRKALESGKISASRFASWRATKIDDSTDCTKIDAVLMVDYTRILPTLSPEPIGNIIDARRSTLSIEIKPKAGFISCSPLISCKRRIKLIKSRFAIQQNLLHSGQIKRGWGRGTKMSAYNPLDMFSQEKSRIKTAIECLIEQPQNNIKIWHCGKMIFGHDNVEMDDDCFNGLLESTFPFLCQHLAESDVMKVPVREQLLNVTADVTTAILAKEPLLHRIRSLQMLDKIDADGAIAVWNRMVGLCSGDEHEAERLVDQQRMSVRDGLGVNGVQHSAYVEPQNYNSLEKFEEQLLSFRTTVRPLQEDGVVPKTSKLDRYHFNTMKLVNDLTKEECAHTLADWLLSLAMCDLSVFVTFRPVTNWRLFEDENFGIQELQTENTPGSVRPVLTKFGDVNMKIAASYLYQLKLVDFDPKPVCKLRNRDESEKSFETVGRVNHGRDGNA